MFFLAKISLVQHEFFHCGAAAELVDGQQLYQSVEGAGRILWNDIYVITNARVKK